MSKYPLDEQFKVLQHIQAPVVKPLASPAQAMMRAFPCTSNAKVKVRKDLVNGTDGNEIPVYILTPRKRAKKDRPCLMNIHGGGFVLAAMPYQYRMAKQYALWADCTVIFPDYRLAPAHPYPAAAEDCYCVYQWILQHAKELKIDPDRIAVGGDSAGGELTAAVTLMARDRGEKLPCFQMLVYPVTDRRMETESARKYVDTPIWNARLSKKMWAFYLPVIPGEHVEYASPMEAPSLKGLPDAYVEVAEYDSLRDEGLQYAQRLKENGVRVQQYQTAGTPHGFEMAGNTPIVLEAMHHRCEVLRAAFGN